MNTIIRYIDKETLQEYKDNGIGIIDVVANSVSEGNKNLDTDIPVEILINDWGYE